MVSGCFACSCCCRCVGFLRLRVVFGGVGFFFWDCGGVMFTEQAQVIEGFWGVVPAGGSGTRLWPLSRSGEPKFLLDLLGDGSSLLQSTVARLEPLTGTNVVVVTGVRHEEAVRAQLPQLGEGGVVAEPSPRDSMAAIGLAAAMIEAVEPEAVIGSFAADHVIGDEGRFRARVREAVEVARTGKLVTLGIEPTFPSTGFGYIRTGSVLEVRGAPHARAVAAFVEKPDAATAARYLATGEYRWNAGMFVVKASVLLDMLADFHPGLAADLRGIAADPSSLAKRWESLEKIAIDHAVAEPAADRGDVAVVLGDFPWDDVGDFASLHELLGRTGGEDAVRMLGSSDVLVDDASGLVASTSGRTVAVLGLDDVVVVDTPDALLVTSRAAAQRVKGIVDMLKADGRAELT